MPDARESTVPLADADLAKARLEMKRPACRVAGHDLRLQRPIAIALRGRNHRREQPATDPLPLNVCLDVYADLSDAGRPSTIGDSCQSGPADDPATFALRHQTAHGEM